MSDIMGDIPPDDFDDWLNAKMHVRVINEQGTLFEIKKFLTKNGREQVRTIVLTADEMQALVQEADGLPDSVTFPSN